MTSKTENLVLEHLRHIRKTVDKTVKEVEEIKLHLLAIENSIALVRAEVDKANKKLD